MAGAAHLYTAPNFYQNTQTTPFDENHISIKSKAAVILPAISRQTSLEKLREREHMIGQKAPIYVLS